MKKVLKYAVLSAFLIAALFPFFWLLSTSFKGAEEIFAFPPKLIPSSPVLDNYSGVWNAVPFGQYFVNSVLIVIFSVTFTVLIASLAGFALARFKFKGKELFFIVVLAAMLAPKEIIIIPLYIIVLKMRLADTLTGVIIPFVADGFAIFLMRQAYSSIPKELEEAALVDGCSLFRLWWSVMTPMTKASIATLSIFTFIGSWGDFLWPLIVLKSSEQYTLQVGLSYMLGTFVNNFRYVAAGAVLATLPVVIVFLSLQKYFEKGIFSGMGK